MDEITNKKQKQSSSEVCDKPNKKAKVFSAKEFRKQLKSNDKLTALNTFLQRINEFPGQDCILTYLENGGNCIELLQTMENDSNILPTLVFEIVQNILLQINAKYPHYSNGAQESCRYLLNTFIPLINKMLSLSSSTKERLVVLKLLTTIVTSSSKLAKEILFNVNLHSANLELLTKLPSGGKSDVRSAFIKFLIAFLVDGYYPTLAVFLEKRYLLTSIVNGLKFDEADLVCLLLTAMKNCILENTSVSKTVKMRLFSTPIVRDLVNLYNWKGPEGLQKKENQNIDELEKSRVNDCVHNFLLILCTSQKYGVIFKDYSMGLGRNNQNSLMYTVLESLERPWEHSYANDLVTKICGACPDLTKTMWKNLKPYLEPRATNKWLNAMKFATKLLQELQPNCLEFCLNELNADQLAQVINFLVVPTPVLKTLLPSTEGCDEQFVKYNVLLLLLEMLKSLRNYLEFLRNSLNDETVYKKLVNLLNNQIIRNFPDAQIILNKWQLNENITNYLDLSFDLFEFYQNFAPQLLENLNSFNTDIKKFLIEINEKVEEEKKIQIKAIRYFLLNEATLFQLNNDLFEFSLGILLQFYYNQPQNEILIVLKKLLENTGVFSNGNNEINCWINAVLNLKNFDGKEKEEITNFLVEIIKFACNNNLQENLLKIALTNQINHPSSKSLKNYLSFVLLSLFHLQIDFTWYNNEDIHNLFSDSLNDYIQSWLTTTAEVEGISLKKWKGRLDSIQKFSVAFLHPNNNFDDYLTNFIEIYPGLKLNLLQTSLFYFSKAINKKTTENCGKFIKFLLNNNFLIEENYFDLIFNCPSLLQNVSLLIDLKSNEVSYYCTTLFMEILNELQKLNYYHLIDLRIYRRKLMELILKLFNNKEKNSNEPMKSLEILNIIQLDYEQCCQILAKVDESLKQFSSIFIYCLGQLAKLCRENLNLKPLDGLIVKKLCNYFIISSSNFDSSLVLLDYFKIFPHNISDIPLEFVDFILNYSNEFNKNNAMLCGFLLERNAEFYENCVKIKLETICEHKAMLLNLLDVFINTYCDDEEVLKGIYQKLEATIMKSLQKPQKSSQHFRNNYQAIGYLIDKFMLKENCRNFVEKIQKFEQNSPEVFHVFLLGKLFEKFTNTEDMSEKIFNNITLTFIHLFKNSKQQQNEKENFMVFCEFLGKVSNLNLNLDLTNLCQKNDNFLQFSKFCLKFGVNKGEGVLLQILSKLLNLASKILTEDNISLILDMLLSHSEFLEVILNETSNNCKESLLELFLIIMRNWPKLMERNHIPFLLASYKATKSSCDEIIINLLKLYEKSNNQTKFYDFKPFLWDRTAANHYSVHNYLQTALWRQPRMGDVLDILQPNLVKATIAAKEGLLVYDLNFLLPLFSNLLSNENIVQTYRFIKSGALSLTIIGLSCDNNKSIRLASCHVLSRFYYHLEAKQNGKDNLLWIRLIKAICLGLSSKLNNNNNCLKLNNFVGIYLARTAMILTQPTHLMYLPLSQYLTAKSSLDFNTIPELYTFLYSSDINFKEHRLFILEILRDGLQNQNDFNIFLKSMAFKLISELYSSVLCDSDSKLLILDIYLNCYYKIPLGLKILCKNHSFLAQIYDIFVVSLKLNSNKDRKGIHSILNKLIELLLGLAKIDDSKHCNFLIFSMLMLIVEGNILCSLKDEILVKFYETLLVIVGRFPSLFTENYINLLLEQSNDKLCKYFHNYGCLYVKKTDFSSSEVNKKDYNLRLLFYNKLKQ